MKRDNKIVVDLSKCQHARFGYRNQHGQWSDTIQENTVRGIPFDPNGMSMWPGITMLENAKRVGILDRWIPEVILKLTANESLAYTGDKAVSIYKEWCGRIFNNNNVTKRTKRK